MKKYTNDWNELITQYRKAHHLKIKETMKILSENKIYETLSNCGMPIQEFIVRCPNMKHEIIFYKHLSEIDTKLISEDFCENWTFDMIDDLDKYVVKRDDYFPFDDFN